MTEATPLPRVAILLATHNGESYVREQLDSILSQAGVELTVIVSDDASTDGTRAILREAADADARVRVLDPGVFGGAAPNFYRLLLDADLDGFDAIGFADQDDVWRAGKLAAHARILHETDADGVSSNCTAFHADGTRTLIRKDFPQRLADHLFETPGAGSTFLLTPRLTQLVREQLRNPASTARQAEAHDWLIYALARSAGLRWEIDPTPTVDYRQHDRNVVGANAGIAPALKRLRLTADGWHRRQVGLIVDACLRVADATQLDRLAWLREVLATRSAANALRLARRAVQFRRRPRDRVALTGLMLLGLW